MKKRALTFLLSLVMCLSLLPVTALAAGGELTRAELAVQLYNKLRLEPVSEGPSFSDIEECTPEQQTAIKALAAAGIVSGYHDGSFGPTEVVTRGAVAMLIWRVSSGGSADAQTIFDDVAEHYCAPAVDFLVAQGVLLPSDAIDGGFKPEDAATEAIISTWLSRLNTDGTQDENDAGKTDIGGEDTGETGASGENTGETGTGGENTGGTGTGGENTGGTGTGGENTGGTGTGGENTGGTGTGGIMYDASGWAQDELARADELGLIPDCLKGQDLTRDITRAEFAAVAVKVYEALSGTAALPAVINPFTDTGDLEVLKAYNVGITNGAGDGTVYEPDTILNREQLSTMLTRVFKRVTMPGWTLATDGQFDLTYEMPAPFADDADISDWARDSVYFMAANKIVEGDGSKFVPRAVTTEEQAIGYANATREQALVIAVRMVDSLGK